MDFKKVVVSALANRSMPMNQKIAFIKQNVNASEYGQALSMHPAFFKYLHQKAHFANVESISLRDPFYFSSDYRKEFKWVSSVLDPYLEVINKFIKYKTEFEKLFILQKYNDANDILEISKKEFGVNLWFINSKLLITEFVEGTEKNWEELSEFLKNINNPFYDFIISANSKRVERKLAYDGYINQFQNDIDNVNSPEVIKDILVFKCFNVANYDYIFERL